MGLDITAYSQIKKLDALFDKDGEPVNPDTREPYEEFFQPCINYDFAKQSYGLEDGAVYSYARTMRFHAGSYTGYNSWREQLAKLVGYSPAAAEGPFIEFIFFSDCDGVIGHKIATKLYKDFQEWDERAKALGDEWFYEKYAEWAAAFKLASDEGAVSFH